MNSFKKIIALVLALLCICSFAACTPGADDAGKENSSGLDLEDGEDKGIEQSKVTVANVTGKDAVSMLVRPSGKEEWSPNVLSQDYFHTNKALELTYTVKESNVYDIRLVFEDGTYQDFTDLDYSATNDYIYLGAAQEASSENK